MAIKSAKSGIPSVSRADQCHRGATLGMAAKAISPLDKETLLRVAEEWIRLAQSTEERRG